MKRKSLTFLMSASAAILFSSVSFAQDTTTVGEDLKNAAKKTGEAVEAGASKAADKTAQIAASTKAAVVDKIYEGKISPDGHRIYIDKNSNYYWIDEKGRKQYIKESEMKNKD